MALPAIIVAIASPATAECQTVYTFGNASSQTRRKAANAAAFTVAAMYAVMADGAPSYTSGAHIWNGTVATLNPNPTSRNAMPASISGPVPAFTPDMRSAIVARFVDPVAPYTSAIP
jgi:hypothetical protein